MKVVDRPKWIRTRMPDPKENCGMEEAHLNEVSMSLVMYWSTVVEGPHTLSFLDIYPPETRLCLLLDIIT
jgi:hypothetical protein